MLIFHFKYQTYFKALKKEGNCRFFPGNSGGGRGEGGVLEIECLYLATVSYKPVIVTYEFWVYFSQSRFFFME